MGECAGEIVSLAEFDLAAAEAQVFEAQLHLEEGRHTNADDMAYGAMLLAAKGLIKTEFIDISDDPDEIVGEFRTRFFETQLFFDKYAGGKFAMYLFRRHDATDRPAPPRRPDSSLRKPSSFLRRVTRARHGLWPARVPRSRPRPPSRGPERTRTR